MHLKKCKIIVLQSNMYMTQMLKGLDELIFGKLKIQECDQLD